MNNEKRNKHIFISITQQQYDDLLFIATKERRKLADLCYIYLSDKLSVEKLKAISIKDGSFKKC